MKTWTDYPELSDAETFRRILSEEGSFDRVAKRLSCDRMSVRRAALVHGIKSPYFVVPKYLRGK
ncbi:MAG: hypothetical protein IKY77_02835 [Methanocorpusculaceae archaeon]|nr:hypothetical protein [Methanocorpusculum sp.]MBR5815117.1 hypothetical protein [Methanocorpusculaceae archaeon]